MRTKKHFPMYLEEEWTLHSWLRQLFQKYRWMYFCFVPLSFPVLLMYYGIRTTTGYRFKARFKWFWQSFEISMGASIFLFWLPGLYRHSASFHNDFFSYAVYYLIIYVMHACMFILLVRTRERFMSDPSNETK